MKEKNVVTIQSTIKANHWKADVLDVFFIKAYISVFRHEMPCLDRHLLSFRLTNVSMLLVCRTY